MENTFINHRKHIYASINGTKGNLTKLSKSTLLSKGEKEKLNKVIEALEDLRVEYYNNRGLMKTEENIKDKITVENLKKLTDIELKSLFTVENTKDLSNKGVVGDIKKYILSGKENFTMSEKINEIEKMTMLIVVDRWLKTV